MDVSTGDSYACLNFEHPEEQPTWHECDENILSPPDIIDHFQREILLHPALRSRQTLIAIQIQICAVDETPMRQERSDVGTISKYTGVCVLHVGPYAADIYS